MKSRFKVGDLVCNIYAPSEPHNLRMVVRANNNTIRIKYLFGRHRGYITNPVNQNSYLKFNSGEVVHREQ